LSCGWWSGASRGVAAAGGVLAAGGRGDQAGQARQAVCVVAGAPSRAVGRRLPSRARPDVCRQAGGQPPVPPVAPAQLGLATILQAYTGASDDEVLEAMVMDRRWQLVVDCMDHAQAPFSKTTLVGFRARLIAHQLDRRLVGRTVGLYGQLTGRVAGGKLRAALDSSPLWGAGRVEDTINLMGHALRKVVGVLARQQGWGLAEGTAVLAEQAGVPELAASSLKAALDLDWDDPAALPHALGVVLAAVGRIEGWPVSLAVPATRQWPRAWPRPGRSATRTWPATSRGGTASPGGGPGPADLDRGCADAPRPQDQEPADRRLQAPRADRSGQRAGPCGGGDRCQRGGGRGRRPDHRRPGRPAAHAGGVGHRPGLSVQQPGPRP